jgi:hypothetical protein
MPHRRLSRVLNILLILLGVLLALTVDYLASTSGAPVAFELLQQWAVPLAVGTLVLITGGQIWLYVLERLPLPKRAWIRTRPIQGLRPSSNRTPESSSVASRRLSICWTGSTRPCRTRRTGS